MDVALDDDSSRIAQRGEFLADFLENSLKSVEEAADGTLWEVE